MSSRKLKIKAYGVATEPTRCHDGTNDEGYAPAVEGFVAQAEGDTHFGEAGVTGADDGFTVRAGETVNILGFLSRGSPSSYDLREIYFIGGPWKLIVEVPA